MYELSIVIVTVCRDSLLRALASIYVQNFQGMIQVLIGIDCDLYNQEDYLKKTILGSAPKFIKIEWINIGYSTSKRHGGVHSCFFGGSLRTALTFLASSRYVMYLDDDDWLSPTHCSLILDSINGRKWAFSYSIYSDGNLSKGLCVDKIESVGIGKGIYANKFGGFVRPSGLAIDKIQLSHIIHLWSESPYETGDGEDRLIFDKLKEFPNDFGCTNEATIFYTIDPKDGMHKVRLDYITSEVGNIVFGDKNESVRTN